MTKETAMKIVAQRGLPRGGLKVNGVPVARQRHPSKGARGGMAHGHFPASSSQSFPHGGIHATANGKFQVK